MTKNRNKFIIDNKEIEAYELSSLFNESPLSSESQRVILVRDKTVLMALIVDETGEVVSIDSESTIKLPRVFKGRSSSCFPKAFKHEDTLVLLVNPYEIQKTAYLDIE